MRIYGSNLSGGKIELNGSVSSQYISALMMVAPYMQNGLQIALTGKVISEPYIDMTAQIMQVYGVQVKASENTIFIEPQLYQPIHYTVESDWSAASYWYETLSILGKGNIHLSGLCSNSCQGDSKVAKIFEPLGVSTTFLTDGVLLNVCPTTATSFEYDFVHQPDLAQTLAVTCCIKGIPFVFSGLQSLKIKETDRVMALKNELKKLGFVLSEPSEGILAWGGERCTKQNVISIATYHDHRMAMAFAPVGLLMPITIENREVVSKSYPYFWEDFNQIANIGK